MSGEPDRKPITDAFVRRLPAPERGNKVYFDGKPAGFGVRVTAAGVKAYVLDYRVKASGQQRRITIGGVPELDDRRGAGEGEGVPPAGRQRRRPPAASSRSSARPRPLTS